MANTYTLIATYTASGGSQANFDFTSIPSTYTDLVIKISGRSTVSGGGTGGAWDNFRTILNNDSGTNYERITILSADGANPISTNGTTDNAIFGWGNYSGSAANMFSNIEHYIFDYASTTTYKPISTDSGMTTNSTSNVLALSSTKWKSNSAVNRITVSPNQGLFAQYSSASLYGIKKL